MYVKDVKNVLLHYSIMHVLKDNSKIEGMLQYEICYLC